jgi:hypothetical protein
MKCGENGLYCPLSFNISIGAGNKHSLKKKAYQKNKEDSNMLTMYKWLCLIVVYEILQTWFRRKQRRFLYEKAKARAQATGKKLLVIGDPHNGIFNSVFGPDYEAGDECLDITGCPTVEQTRSKKYKGKVEDILPQMDLSKRIVFISCVLEYVDDIEKVNSILSQMDQQDIFIVTVSPWTMEAWIYPQFITGEQPSKRVVFYDGKKITWLANPFFYYT